MSLSCSCDYESDWFYSIEDGERYACSEGICYGCGNKINIGDDVRLMWEYEHDENGDEINCKVLGRLCPVCSGHYDSLTIDLGFCLEADQGFIKTAMYEYRTEYLGLDLDLTCPDCKKNIVKTQWNNNSKCHYQERKRKL